MGRTARQRKTKKNNLLLSNCKIKLSHDLTLINLLSWLKLLNWVPFSQLHPTNFPVTGRGLMAGKKIAANDVLVQIPLCALITSKTVDESNISQILARKALLSQEILTAFLIMERKKNTESKWAPYIYSLPNDFSTPLYLSLPVLEFLPKFLKNSIVNLLADSHQSFLRLKELFPNLHKDEFKWAWSCVNTRAVYLPKSLKKKETFKLQIMDPDCLALAPYLDLFNHSNNVSVEVKVTLDGYALLTQTPYKKHDQVFINYGPHANLKLFLEYGFAIPGNPHDSLSLNEEDLMQVAGINFETCNKIVEAKIALLRSQGLVSSAAFHREGITWSALAALRLLHSPCTNPQEWLDLLYSDTANELDTATTENIIRLAQHLEQSLYQCSQKLDKYFSMKASTSADRALIFLVSELKDVARCAHQSLTIGAIL